MSIRQALLALLAEQPMHGYQLRQEFEARTGGTWPLNIGQAYTTVQRLERDGLVEAVPTTEEDAPERFTVTEAGRAEAAGWWLRPVEHGAPRRDELAIKLALAVTAPGVDVGQVIQRQRAETLRALRAYTRLKSRPADAPPDPHGDLSWELVLDSLIFALEAEMRWLDHVEAKVHRAAITARRSPAAPTAAPPPTPTGTPGAEPLDDPAAPTTAPRAAAGAGATPSPEGPRR